MRHLWKLFFVMSILVLNVAVALVPSSAAASAISFDTSTSWIGQANTVTLSITTSRPNEILLVGCVYNTNWGAIVPVNSTLTFFEIRHYDSYSPSTGINVHYALLAKAQTYTVTINYPPGVVNNMGIILSAFSGENTANPVVQNVRAKGTTGVPSTTLTPVNSADLIWAFTASGNPTTQTAGQGFTLDQQRTYFGSPADEFGFGQSQVEFGTSVFGLWLLIAVEIQVPMVAGQVVPVNVSPSTTASAGSTLTVSANTAGLVFFSPTYSWTATGCPDFVNPGSVSTFSYASKASGTTTNCVFNVAVSDNGGDTGSGQSAVVTIKAVKGQAVPVNVSPTTTAPKGSTLTVSASIAGLVFSGPTYAWTSAGCPDFVNPGSVASFSYVSTPSGTTNNCVFSVSVSDSFGNTGSGNSPTVVITNPVTGQAVPVNVSPSTTAPAGSTLTVSVNLGGLVFSNPTYSWTAAGCPDFVNPGSVNSFSYVSTASGKTTNCVFSVSVSDVAGDTGSGNSATVTINPKTGQAVPVNVSPSTTAPAGSTLTVSVNLGGLVFSSPTFAWTAAGCPDFVNPGSVSSFSYVSKVSGTTSNCVFSVTMSDSFGNTGSGQSPTVTITTPNPAILDTSKVVFGQFSSTTIQITTSHPNEVIFVGVGFNDNYQINTPTAFGLSFTPFGSGISGGASLGGQAYYAIAGAAQQYSITVSYAGGVQNNMGILVSAFYGENPNAPFDGPFASAASGGVTSIPTVNVSPTHAGETIWAFQVNANCVTQTAGAGYILDQSVGCYESPADEYARGVSSGSQAVSFGVSTRNWIVFAVAIQ